MRITAPFLDRACRAAGRQHIVITEIMFGLGASQVGVKPFSESMFSSETLAAAKDAGTLGTRNSHCGSEKYARRRSTV
jgi:hypothetical protein